MIDLHCHILPGIDDGAQSLEDSLAMAHMAVAEGITHILVTPHHKNGVFINEKNEINQKLIELQNEFDLREIPISLFPGQEVRINGELMEEIADGKIQFIDEEDQYLLIEFPTMSVPAYSENLFFELSKKGIIPIIVHPERNQVFMDNPNALKPFIERGALAQLTAGSYLGKFGKKIQKVSKQMLEANLVHFIASDAHNTASRSFLMKAAYDKLGQDFGNRKAESFKQLTKDLINGEIINVNAPKNVKEHKIFGLF